MKLFKRKNKKKLTTDQLISRWSIVILVVVLGVGIFFTLKNTLNDVKGSAIGNTSVFDYLNEKFYADTIVTESIITQDKENLKTKTTDAGLDLFKNNYITKDKYINVGNANNFSITANESAFLVNEIMAITQNQYNIDYKQIIITKSENKTTIKYIASIRFISFCGMTSTEKDVYKELGYIIPDTVYLTTTATIIGDNVSCDTVFNALDNAKCQEVKAFMDSRNMDEKIEEFCHNNFINNINDFCTRTNTTFAFLNGGVGFSTTLGA